MAATPPWTMPIGLYIDSSGSRTATTSPWPMLSQRSPKCAAIGGPGMRPSAMAVRYSKPVIVRPSRAVGSGSCQVMVFELVPASAATSVIWTPRASGL